MTTLLMIVALAGCNRGSSGYSSVNGTVTLDGSPLAIGTISFESVPEGEDAAPRRVMTVIRDGKYMFSAEDGPSAGSQKVYIDSIQQPSAEELKAAENGRRNEGRSEEPVALPQAVNLVPEKYNRDSKLKTKLVNGDNPNTDFDLSTE